MVVVKGVTAFRDEKIEDAAHGTSIAIIRHPIIWVVHFVYAFGNQPLFLVVVLACAVRPRIVDLFAKTETRDYKPITADRYQNVNWANITMNVIFFVDER